MSTTKSEEELKKNDPTIYARMFETVRPLVQPADIHEQRDNHLEFFFIDPIMGRLKLRMYAHQGSAVVTCWENNKAFNGSSLAYVHNAATDEVAFNAWQKLVVGYLKDPFKHYEKPMLESWQYIENQMGSFVSKYGATRLTGKILKLPFLTDEEKVKLLSYLTLEGTIREAKEREAIWEMGKLKVAESVTLTANDTEPLIESIRHIAHLSDAPGDRGFGPHDADDHEGTDEFGATGLEGMHHGS